MTTRPETEGPSRVAVIVYELPWPVRFGWQRRYFQLFRLSGRVPPWGCRPDSFGCTLPTMYNWAAIFEPGLSHPPRVVPPWTDGRFPGSQGYPTRDLTPGGTSKSGVCKSVRRVVLCPSTISILPFADGSPRTFVQGVFKWYSKDVLCLAVRIQLRFLSCIIRGVQLVLVLYLSSFSSPSLFEHLAVSLQPSHSFVDSSSLLTISKACLLPR